MVGMQRRDHDHSASSVALADTSGPGPPCIWARYMQSPMPPCRDISTSSDGVLHRQQRMEVSSACEGIVSQDDMDGMGTRCKPA